MPSPDALADALAAHAPVHHPDLPGRSNHIQAGVLVGLRWEPDPTCILTVRASQMRAHAGEVCFPGGRPEPGDADLQATAAREAAEEVGLVVEAWLGRLSSWPVYTSPHRLEPFVARLAPGPFRPAADEVAAVVAVPLRDWLDAPAIAGIPWVHEGRTHMSPVFELGPHLLFGATAHAFLELLQIAAAARGQPLPPWDPHRYTWEQFLIRR